MALILELLWCISLIYVKLIYQRDEQKNKCIAAQDVVCSKVGVGPGLGSVVDLEGGGCRGGDCHALHGQGCRPRCSPSLPQKSGLCLWWAEVPLGWSMLSGCGKKKKKKGRKLFLGKGTVFWDLVAAHKMEKFNACLCVLDDMAKMGS